MFDHRMYLLDVCVIFLYVIVLSCTWQKQQTNSLLLCMSVVIFQTACVIHRRCCELASAKALNQQDFGKVVKHVFRSVTYRRLGNRSNSKYPLIDRRYCKPFLTLPSIVARIAYVLYLCLIINCPCMHVACISLYCVVVILDCWSHFTTQAFVAHLTVNHQVSLP